MFDDVFYVVSLWLLMVSDWLAIIPSLPTDDKYQNLHYDSRITWLEEHKHSQNT